MGKKGRCEFMMNLSNPTFDQYRVQSSVTIFYF
jgi:hypothetical protein